MTGSKVSKMTVSLFAVALLGLSACGGGEESSEGSSEGGAASGGGATIELSAIDSEFEPTDLEVKAGEEVTVNFTNNGEIVHTFTSEELGFDSGNIEGGDSKTVTFTAPDEDVKFVCTIHETSDDMVGAIVVE
jgi:plastocyanin